MSGFIPLQRGLVPSRGPAFNMDRGDRDSYQRYSASGMPSRWGQYTMTTRPMGEQPMGQQPMQQGQAPTPMDMPGRGGYAQSPFVGSQSARQLPNQQQAMRGGPGGQWNRNQSGDSTGSGIGAPRPETGGGLTVEGGPDMYRETTPGQAPVYNWNTQRPVPPPANQATGLLSEPARFGKFDSRRDQFQNMQSKIADYQASAATDPNYDQNQLNRMQGRLNYLGRMRRSGR